MRGIRLRFERHSDLEPFRARCLDRAVEVVARLDVNRNGVAARRRDRLEVLLRRLGHQVAVDHAVHPMDLLRDRLQHDRADRDRLDEVAVANVEVEDANAGAHQRLDLLAESREIRRIEGRLDLDRPHPLGPRHDAAVYCGVRRAMKKPLVR